MQIIPILCLQDNYAYLLHDEKSAQTAVVDPSESGPILSCLKKNGWSLHFVFSTHHHWDHTGGNLELKKETGCAIVGAANDAHRIPGIDKEVGDGETFLLGETPVQVLEIPGHTLGHIAYYLPKTKSLFCGDTLFSLGCGRLFEGTASQMWASLQKLSALPEETLVYPGHEYTESNLKFAMSLEPSSSLLSMKKNEVQRLRSQTLPTIPSILSEEKRLNPFLKCKDANEFGKLRSLKDDFT